MTNQEIKLKEGEKFIPLFLEDKIEYSSQSSHTEAGCVINETVNARIKYTDDLPFINSGLKYYVCKLYSNTHFFFLGSVEYPAELTYLQNKVWLDLSFKASNPT